MVYRILSILILFTTSATSIQSKTFNCKERFHTSQCTIADVGTQESIILSVYSSNGINNLTILNSAMDDIPSISSHYSVNLYYLNCVGCGLPDLTKHSFSRLSNLITLNISFGSYEKLQKNLFSQVPSLTRLNVSHGAIVEVDDNAFSNSANLQFLDLSFNKITNLTSNMFSPLLSLWSLSLSYNQINVLHKDLFINNTKLNYLFLDHNDIIEIEGAIFNSEHIVNTVTLSFNELTVLDTANVGAMKVWADHNKLKNISISSSIELLIVSNNYIENVACDEKRSVITTLHMSNNSLTGLGCIGSLSQLNFLYLSYNNIGKLNQSTFATLTELKSLFLKSSNIGKLDYGIFSHQNKLEVLDISYNHMGNIDLEMLLAAKDLQHLYMDGNNITEFSYSDLKSAFISIQTVGIGDNDFNCTFLAQAIKKLNSNNIQAIVSTGYKVTDTHNVNGIGCRVKNEKTSLSWMPDGITTVNNTNDTKNVESNVKLDAVIQQVETLTKIKAVNDKIFTKLSDDNAALKQQLSKVSNDILSNKAEILKLELTKTSNATNSSNTMLWTLINQLNNITLEKQQVSNQAQLQEINELKFEIDKNSYKLSDVYTKIDKLMKEETSSTSSTGQSNSHSDYDLIRNLNIILITLIVAFCIYKGYKFVKNDVPRIRRYNTANTLHTNIEMDNSSAR